MMKIRLVSANKTHKAKETAADCVDAFDISEDRRRMAVSDGVTRSLYPGEFANSVVRGFCQVAEASDWHKWMSQARERWLEKAEDRVEELKRTQSPAYVNNQGRLDTRVPGAATFAGVEFDPETNNARLIIMGDSCVFVFADGKLVDSFPYKNSSQFDNQPNAFQSYAPDKNRSEPEPEIRDLPAVPDGAKGAHWVFATDALAMWILGKHENGVNVLPRLLAIKDNDGGASFARFVDNARKADKGALCDDVTLVVASVGEPELPFPPSAEEPDAADGAANPSSHSTPSSPAQSEGASRDSSANKQSMPMVAPPFEPLRSAARGNAKPYYPDGSYGNQKPEEKRKNRGLKITVIFLALIMVLAAAIFVVIKQHSKNDPNKTISESGSGTDPTSHAMGNTNKTENAGSSDSSNENNDAAEKNETKYATKEEANTWGMDYERLNERQK